MRNQRFPHGRHIGMERVDYDSVCREMFGGIVSSDLIPSESDRTWIDWTGNISTKVFAE